MYSFVRVYIENGAKNRVELPLNRLRRIKMNRNHKQCTTHPNYIAAKARSAATRQEKQSQIISDYSLNPSKCATCFAPLDYKIRKNKFCSRSCAAVFNNKNKTVESKEKRRQSLKQTLAAKDYYPYVGITLKMCKVCSKEYFVRSGRKRLCCSNQCRSVIFSKTATDNKAMGGNKNTRAYGWYTSKIAGRVWLESSYEYKVANYLDANNIKWIRPGYLPYVIDGKQKRYYPDFYLIDRDLYLDPKNDFLIQKDAEKIQLVQEQNNVKIQIIDKEDLKNWS